MVYNAKEYIFLQGKTKWFRPTQFDSKFEPPRWNHVLYPNDESLDKVRKLQSEGVKNTLKLDDDGYYITLARPCYKEYRDKQTNAMKKMIFDPPVVLDAEGKPLGNVPVGNGSDITTKMEVYTHGKPGGGKAKAMRWESSRIDNLIPFEKKTDFNPEEQLAVKNLDKQPEQLF